MESSASSISSILVFIKSFMIDGGELMWVILLVWLTGIALAIHKFAELKLMSIDPSKFYEIIKRDVVNNDVESAIKTCSSSQAVLPKVLRAGLMRANSPKEFIEDAVNTAIIEHTPSLSYRLGYISLSANLSTLIGLLGTIQGLIISFAGVAAADPGTKARILAEGIAKAMNTTALGLVSAITIMICHSILVSRAQRTLDRVEESSSKLIDLLSMRKYKDSLVKDETK